ncbi:Pentatricopeptide repeat [Dillenia turbinata]|uniref:Pentatricopeptide repeat n=1 Tax=Dillenia turbinata TaxID=194707 RepID=A0AAN8Z0F3_9MAGN
MFSGRRPGDGYDCASLHIVMWACLKEGKLEEAEEFYREAKDGGIRLYAVAYDTLIQAVLGPLRVKNEMVGCGIPMNLVIITSLMKGYRVQSNLKNALNLFAKLKEDGLIPNKATFAVLIEGCCRSGQMEKAHELYIQMKNNGISPSVFIVNSVLQCLLKAHMWEDALKHSDEAVELGVSNNGVAPSVVSLNNIILGHCRKGNMDAASGLHSEMLQKGLKPNVVTYSILVDACFQKGNIEQAFLLLDEMVGSKIVPTDFTFNIVICGLCRAGHTSEGKNILTKFMVDGFVPTCMTYNSITAGFVKEGTNNFDLALEMWNEIEKQVIYNSMINGNRNLNNLDEALRIHKKMVEEGVPCDLEISTTLIDGSLKDEKLHHASDLYSEMLARDITPDIITFTERNFKEAFRLHDEMLDKGITPDNITYDILVNGKVRSISLPAGTDGFK